MQGRQRTYISSLLHSKNCFWTVTAQPGLYKMWVNNWKQTTNLMAVVLNQGQCCILGDSWQCLDIVSIVTIEAGVLLTMWRAEEWTSWLPDWPQFWSSAQLPGLRFLPSAFLHGKIYGIKLDSLFNNVGFRTFQIYRATLSVYIDFTFAKSAGAI